MAVTGANKVKSNLRKVFNDISDKKSLQFLNAVLAGAANISKQKAPIEFGTLVNSQRTDATKGAYGAKGSLGYYTNYANYLNNPTNKRSGVLSSSRNSAPKPLSMSGFGKSNIFNTNLIKKASQTLSPGGMSGTWKPRPPLLKKGNAWNPDAEPHFLEYGFESPEGIKNINDNLKIFRV